MIRKIILLTMLVCLSLIGSTQAQEVKDEGNAHIRVLHTLLSPRVQVHFDDELFAGEVWGETYFDPFWSYPYLDFPAGEYELSVVVDGEDYTEVPTQSVNLQPDQLYTLVIYENDPLRYIWIDETATLDGHDPSEEALYILVNIMQGVSPLSVVIDGETTLADVGYGEFALGIDPSGPVETVQILNAEGEVVFDWPGLEVVIPDTYFVQLYMGSYPGEAFEDYFAYSAPKYVGELSLTDGPPIVLEERYEGQIEGEGHRVRHELHLSEDSVLNFELFRSVPSEYAFPTGLRLRLYDENGAIVWHNKSDEGAVTLYSYELAAGDYTVEVGTTGDVDAAEYGLIISAN